VGKLCVANLSLIIIWRLQAWHEHASGPNSGPTAGDPGSSTGIAGAMGNATQQAQSLCVNKAPGVRTAHLLQLVHNEGGDQGPPNEFAALSTLVVPRRQSHCQSELVIALYSVTLVGRESSKLAVNSALCSLGMRGGTSRSACRLRVLQWEDGDTCCVTGTDSASATASGNITWDIPVGMTTGRVSRACAGHRDTATRCLCTMQA
jgi:hypothetical protein